MLALWNLSSPAPRSLNMLKKIFKLLETPLLFCTFWMIPRVHSTVVIILLLRFIKYCQQNGNIWSSFLWVFLLSANALYSTDPQYLLLNALAFDCLQDLNSHINWKSPVYCLHSVFVEKVTCHLHGLIGQSHILLPSHTYFVGKNTLGWLALFTWALFVHMFHSTLRGCCCCISSW